VQVGGLSTAWDFDGRFGVAAAIEMTAKIVSRALQLP
jgi:hypothetical protein